MKDILKVTNELRTSIYKPPPQPAKALWGGLILSIQFV